MMRYKDLTKIVRGNTKERGFRELPGGKKAPKTQCDLREDPRRRRIDALAIAPLAPRLRGTLPMRPRRRWRDLLRPSPFPDLRAPI